MGPEIHRDGLARGELARRPVRPRLDEEDELFPLLAGEDHRRREFRVPRDEADLGVEVRRAPVAGKTYGLIDLERSAHWLGDEEAHLEIARRQQRHHCLAGIHPLAWSEIALLDGPARRRHHRTLSEILLRLHKGMARGFGIGGS